MAVLNCQYEGTTLVLGVMNFVFMDADVIRRVNGVDVNLDDYIERYGDLLFQMISGLFVKT